MGHRHPQGKEQDDTQRPLTLPAFSSLLGDIDFQSPSSSYPSEGLITPEREVSPLVAPGHSLSPDLSRSGASASLLSLQRPSNPPSPSREDPQEPIRAVTPIYKSPLGQSPSTQSIKEAGSPDPLASLVISHTHTVSEVTAKDTEADSSKSSPISQGRERYPAVNRTVTFQVPPSLKNSRNQSFDQLVPSAPRGSTIGQRDNIVEVHVPRITPEDFSAGLTAASTRSSLRTSRGTKIRRWIVKRLRRAFSFKFRRGSGNKLQKKSRPNQTGQRDTSKDQSEPKVSN